MPKLFTAALTFLGTAIAFPVLAADPPESAIQGTIKGLGNTASQAGLGGSNSSLFEVVGSFIQAGLAVVGVIFLLMAIYAGFQLLTSSDPKKLTEVRNILVNAVLGIIIIFSAYAIANFVIQTVLNTSGTSTPESPEEAVPANPDEG
jgi:hypothetical protein